MPETAVTMENLIGPYGPWAAKLIDEEPAPFSFRHERWQDTNTHRAAALERVQSHMGIPDLGPTPTVQVLDTWSYDGLEIEDIAWQLPYGRATKGYVLKPQGAQGPLPGILAFHDHGGNKYFGRRKITRVRDDAHPLMVEHQDEYYEGRAWANEIAKLGYVVLVSDAFTFASRRVHLADVPEYNRNGLTDSDPENADNIEAYNRWAANHEHIMAKSLFCAGTTWPGVFFAEDKVALDILCHRPEVDTTRVGCAGLSGGGLRTVFMAGLDARIKCAVCVGFMTTWRDFLLHKSFTHTWMAYVPQLPRDMDFPEILALRAPAATLVQNDEHDFLYTLPQMQRADKIMSDIYTKAGAPDRYRCSFYPGPHKFDLAMQTEAFDWFGQHLG